MKCELNYCIYHMNDKCTLDEVQINSLGMCNECIIVSVDRDYLEKAKHRQLEDIKIRGYAV